MRCKLRFWSGKLTQIRAARGLGVAGWAWATLSFAATQQSWPNTATAVMTTTTMQAERLGDSTGPLQNI